MGRAGQYISRRSGVTGSAGYWSGGYAGRAGHGSHARDRPSALTGQNTQDE